MKSNTRRTAYSYNNVERVRTKHTYYPTMRITDCFFFPIKTWIYENLKPHRLDANHLHTIDSWQRSWNRLRVQVVRTRKSGRRRRPSSALSWDTFELLGNPQDNRTSQQCTGKLSYTGEWKFGAKNYIKKLGGETQFSVSD